MRTDEIIIANLKCNGCATTINNKLSAMAGVSSVKIDNDKDQVIVEHDEKTSRTDLLKQLESLGYPEATAENGLLLQLKSYASCMVGRVSNMTN